MTTPDRACPDYPNNCMHPWAHARTYAEVKATQTTDPRTAELTERIAEAIRAAAHDPEDGKCGMDEEECVAGRPHVVWICAGKVMSIWGDVDQIAAAAAAAVSGVTTDPRTAAFTQPMTDAERAGLDAWIDGDRLDTAQVIICIRAAIAVARAEARREVAAELAAEFGRRADNYVGKPRSDRRQEAWIAAEDIALGAAAVSGVADTPGPAGEDRHDTPGASGRVCDALCRDIEAERDQLAQQSERYRLAWQSARYRAGIYHGLWRASVQTVVGLARTTQCDGLDFHFLTPSTGDTTPPMPRCDACGMGYSCPTHDPGPSTGGDTTEAGR